MKLVKCPTCQTDVEWIEKNKFRPFCSERCKQIDLGAWAQEQYVIASVSENSAERVEKELQSKDNRLH